MELYKRNKRTRAVVQRKLLMLRSYLSKPITRDFFNLRRKYSRLVQQMVQVYRKYSFGPGKQLLNLRNIKTVLWSRLQARRIKLLLENTSRRGVIRKFQRGVKLIRSKSSRIRLLKHKIIKKKIFAKKLKVMDIVYSKKKKLAANTKKISIGYKKLKKRNLVKIKNNNKKLNKIVKARNKLLRRKKLSSKFRTRNIKKKKNTKIFRKKLERFIYNRLLRKKALLLHTQYNFYKFFKKRAFYQKKRPITLLFKKIRKLKNAKLKLAKYIHKKRY